MNDERSEMAGKLERKVVLLSGGLKNGGIHKRFKRVLKG